MINLVTFQKINVSCVIRIFLDECAQFWMNCTWICTILDELYMNMEILDEFYMNYHKKYTSCAWINTNNKLEHIVCNFSSVLCNVFFFLVVVFFFLYRYDAIFLKTERSSDNFTCIFYVLQCNLYILSYYSLLLLEFIVQDNK